ncbi:MAG: EAL domain-containing protein [Pseudomonadota bacterium]
MLNETVASEPTGLIDFLGEAAIETLAQEAVDAVLIFNEAGKLRWASNSFLTRIGSAAPSVAGLEIDSVLALLGRMDDPELSGRLMKGAGRETLTLINEDLDAIAFRIAAAWSAGDRARPRCLVVTMTDISPLTEQLTRAERAKNAIEQRLNFDVDTGLPNERRTLEIIFAALRGAEEGEDVRSVGVFLIEVMDFREIVDLYGADLGGEVLQELAFSISDTLGPDQFVARTKEHEFAVVFPSVDSMTSLISTAETLIDQLCFEVSTELGDYRVQTIMSIAEMPVGTGSPDQLLNNARLAMGFRELPRRAGQIRVYEPEMRSALEARSRTYNELHNALENDEIEPFFQPQIRLEDRAVVGFEVLVRWRHPEQGLVPPGLFLEIAEETGLLPAIDDVVLRKALVHLAQWREQGYTEPRISLNCTGESLRDPGYIDKLCFELEKNNLAPKDVAIEILENVLFKDEQDEARATLDRLEELGFFLEIDDFGTGQASISHLINLNADAVKLDRSLVRDIVNDRASRFVVEATVMLSRNLGLETVAEGAENEEQMQLLTELGCGYAQGFGIARPMPFDETTRWLEDYTAKLSDPVRRSA